MSTLSLTKKARICNRQKSASSVSVAGKAVTATCKGMKLDYHLTSYTKLNSKYIKELNIRPETIKLLEKDIGSIFLDINRSKILYDPPPRVMEIRTKINKCDLIKLKSFCTTKKKNKHD